MVLLELVPTSFGESHYSRLIGILGWEDQNSYQGIFLKQYWVKKHFTVSKTFCISVWVSVNDQFCLWTESCGSSSITTSLLSHFLGWTPLWFVPSIDYQRSDRNSLTPKSRVSEFLANHIRSAFSFSLHAFLHIGQHLLKVIKFLISWILLYHLIRNISNEVRW